jgi:hypothetical protein
MASMPPTNSTRASHVEYEILHNRPSLIAQHQPIQLSYFYAQENSILENMSAKKKHADAKVNKQKDSTDAKVQQRKELDEKVVKAKIDAAREMHFVPTILLFIILVCSGGLTIMSYRDMCATGKVIFGKGDAAMLHFTGSTKWYDDSNGWKSTAGGFSSVHQITTDENDMGGYFIRKMAGAAALGFHLQKLVPVLFQGSEFHWGCGHFQPMLLTSVLGNLAVAGFYMSHSNEFKTSNAENMGLAVAAALVFEAVAILAFLVASLAGKKRSSLIGNNSFPAGKGPKSIVSKIMARTFCMVSGMIMTLAFRELFFPGIELPFPPYDDIYLEWTGALIHSPPKNSVEEREYGLESPLHVGDKFVSRLMGLYILIICFQKFISGFLIRVGKDNNGEKKCRTFWRVQCISNILLLFTIRVFAPAALSASLDFRWHVMSLGYETFILGLNGYF